MSSKTAENLRQHFSRYLDAPTQQRQTALINAAEQYRENWIEEQAAEKPSRYPIPQDSLGSRSPARWDGDQPGTSVTHVAARGLYLECHQLADPLGFRRPQPTSLRLQGGRLDHQGQDDKYVDLERNPEFEVTLSNDLNTTRRPALLQEITMPGESWGDDPFFVVLNDPHGSWRKILLVNRETGIATFRSTTTDASYMPRKTMRPGSAWFLDNSMQDTNVQQAQVLLTQLRRIGGELS